MAKFNALQFHQPVKNLDGKVVNRQVEITKEDIDAAKAAGKEMLETKEVPLTVQFAIRKSLTALVPQSAERPIDIHEEKKYELFELTRKIVNLPAEDQEVELTSDEIGLINTRAKKLWGVEVFGFLYEVLEGKNTAFKTVKTETNVAVAN